MASPMVMSLGKLRKMVKDRETWSAAGPWGRKELETTEQLNNYFQVVALFFSRHIPHSQSFAMCPLDLFCYREQP